MATQTTIQQQLPPEYVQERQKDLLLTLFGSQGEDPTLPDGSPNPNFVQGLINHVIYLSKLLQGSRNHNKMLFH